MKQLTFAFEGFEKRLEIKFSNPSVFIDPLGLGLRALTPDQISSFLKPACCKIIAHLSNSNFDTYLLSESSLFLYPGKIIIKTCGTTKLLLSIPILLQLSQTLSHSPSSVTYSRGSFIFPAHQPFPHSSFCEEVEVLNKYFSSLHPEAHILGDVGLSSNMWHVYSTSSTVKVEAEDINFEVCMTGLAKEKAAIFFKNLEWDSAKEMTKASGIAEIFPSHTILDYHFHPCGYSMNGIEGAAYSTVHVTPEEGYSYASYEAMGFDPLAIPFESLLKRVICCFEPDEFSVVVRGGAGCRSWAKEDSNVEGYMGGMAARQELRGGRWVVYLTYKAKAKRSSPERKVGGGGDDRQREEQER